MAKASFYVYFADENNAKGASARLEDQGYKVNITTEDDGRFLAQADKAIRAHDIDKAEQEIDAVVIQFTGEYDGYSGL
ncbi:MAG: ribonuclease E inhibitor RraB [Solirubrobacteraceae bacterium]|nr:ribonuclease E inhibitor RraB [Patulibacter sp.]